jgi:hypothetical protein
MVINITEAILQFSSLQKALMIWQLAIRAINLHPRNVEARHNTIVLQPLELLVLQQ